MTKSASPDPQSHWEKQAIELVILEHIKDQRSARRWTALYRFSLLAVIGFVLFQAFKWDLSPSSSSAILQENHTAVIDIRGPIDADQLASADNINGALDAAFDSKWVRGVILRINSPGGSTVQSRQIYDKIQSLQAKNDKKVYALIEDMGTSAAYLIASSAEEIHADKTSLVGSIGVIMEGFGFSDAMQKWGVDRRLYIAGQNKAMLDPFSPRNPEQEHFIQQELDGVHRIFIQNVRDGRKDRLKETPDIFSGLFWSGERALSLGLIDGHKNASDIAKDLIKAENMVDYTPGISMIDRIANRLGMSVQSIDLQTHLKKQALTTLR